MTRPIDLTRTSLFSYDGSVTKPALPPEVRDCIPKNVDKGIYHRLYERKDGSVRLVWWVKVYDKSGNPVYESADSSRYEDAVRLKKKLIGQIENEMRAGGDPDSVRINELFDDLLGENGTEAKAETKYIYKLVIDSHLRPFFGKLKASKLTTDHLKNYRKKRKAELIGKHVSRALKAGEKVTEEDRSRWAKAAGATVNRELARLRTAFELGTENTPPKVLRIPKFPMDSEKDNVRKVVMQDSEYAKVRDAFDDLGVQLLFVVSSHVGIRASELRRIRWDQVDFQRGIIVLERRKTKNDDPRSAPIYGDMAQYLAEEKRRHDEFYPASPWVFSRQGEKIKDFREEWRKAISKAAVLDLHFHDLRRTAQRMMRRAGIDKITRMKIMGHKTDAMDIRYGVVEDEDVVESVDKLDREWRRRMGVEPASLDSVQPGLAAKIAGLPPEQRELVESLLRQLGTERNG